MMRTGRSGLGAGKKLVSIDSSDPGAYEGEIGERLYEYLSRCCERCGGSLADQIQIAREEVLPGRFNVMARIPGKTNGPGLIYICHMDTVMLGDGWDENDAASGSGGPGNRGAGKNGGAPVWKRSL